MAVSRMNKVMIASHRSEVAELLEVLQREGLVQVLDAEQAMVSKEWPELHIEAQRPRDLEERVKRLDQSIAFLKTHVTEKDGTSLFQPLVPVDKSRYAAVVDGSEALELLGEAEDVRSEIEKLGGEKEHLQVTLEMLGPWAGMDAKFEELRQLTTTTCFTGILPGQNFESVSDELAEIGCAIEQVGQVGTMAACVAACMSEAAGDTQKVLRNGDFETVSFEGYSGTVRQAIEATTKELEECEERLAEAAAKAGKLAGRRLELQILFDHYRNLLDREVARSNSPATENTVLLEGWVKEKEYGRLEEVAGGFAASSVAKMELHPGEEPPVEIDNGKMAKPFEIITRLYGMPHAKDLDPTAFLAPFFAMFFGICLTDAAYGLIMIAVLWWAIRKMHGDKGFLWLFMACSVSTVIAGALTGGWFGDAVVTLVGEGSWLDNLRVKMMLFDPMKEPMIFFGLALGIGYIQIVFGICLALYNNLRHKDYAAAIFEQVTWLVLLNSLLLLGLCKAGLLPAGLSKIFGILAIVQGVLIFFFTERKSGMAGRIGGGVFALFNTVFYFGDILSYVRLMALGMVTAGLGMAVNILVRLIMDIPYVGFILGALLFVGGHLFNMAMSTLSSFVHSLRLQFVEFFPKFLTGGGKDFKPLHENYKHISVGMNADNN